MSSINTKIIGIFEDRAPNSLFAELIQSELEEYDLSIIENALADLEAKGIIKSQGGRLFVLSNYGSIQSKKYITIDNLKIRRLLGGDPVSAEAINMALEKISEYSSGLESKYSKIAERKMKSYWANIIVIFGIFISIFSIIGNMAGKIQIESSWSLIDIFLKNLMQVLPLTVILITFIIVLKIVFK